MIAGCGTPTIHRFNSRSCDGDNIIDSCNRSFRLYVPSQLCDETSSGYVTDTVPLVFALHCLGCNSERMMTFSAIADQFGFVFVSPEGLNHSWNAKYCCGFSQENGINDVKFLTEIIDYLTGRMNEDTINMHGLVKDNLVYGLGWSNGAYLVTYAADIFRAVSPISGHIYNVETDVPLNLFKDQQKGIGIFLHHSMNDPAVRFTGCCSDKAMPKCCCHISDGINSPETCTSAEVLFESWASEINGCHVGEMSESFSNTEIGVTCRTFNNKCIANSTVCIYEHSGHLSSFPDLIRDEIGNFFAEDACAASLDGTWNRHLRMCECNMNRGLYCHEISDSHHEEVPIAIKRSTFFISATCLASVIIIAWITARKVLPKCEHHPNLLKSVEMSRLVSNE